MRTVRRLTRNLGRKAVSIGFILTGFALLALALMMAWVFGEELGALPLEKMVYGGAHVGLHLFGTLSAFSIAMFVMDKSKAFAALAVFAMLLVRGYGIVNMVGFASKDRGGVAMAAEENAKRAMNKYHEDRTYLEGRIKWLEGESFNTDNSPKSRKDHKIEATVAKAKLQALEPPKVSAETINPDGSANLLSRLTSNSTSDASQMLAIPVGILLYMGEVLSFIFGVRIWPRVKDDEVTIELRTHQVAASEEMIAVLRAAAGQPVMPAPATMRSVVPAEPIEVVPANNGVVPAKDEVPARVVPGHRNVPAQHEEVPAQGELPMAANSNLRSARPAEHVGVVVAALRRLGLTQDVPAQDIHALYPSFMVQAGIAPISTKVFCEHLAKVCERDRKRVGEIEDEASNTRKKMTVYTLPDESAAKVGFRPRPMGTIKAAPSRPRFKQALGTIGVQSPAIVSRGARMNGHSLPARPTASQRCRARGHPGRPCAGEHRAE
jgi:hypothetical protein